MPGMKTVGRKTAERTQAMAMTGPETSSMAFFVASLGDRPFSYVVLHRLDDDNSVIDDEADGEDHAHEGDGIDAETEERETWQRSR